MNMFVDVAEVYLHRDPVDFRKSINGLSAIVELSMNLPLNPDALFVFCSRSRDKLETIYGVLGKFPPLKTQFSKSLILYGIRSTIKINSYTISPDFGYYSLLLGGIMAFHKRLTVLIDSEINDLYGPPKYSIEEQRLYFTLNDDEEQALLSIRNRSHKCFFIVLLGYFKSKPIVLSPSFGEVEDDLKFIAKELYPEFGIRRFSLTQKLKDRLYQNIFELVRHQKWDVSQHQMPIVEHLQQVATSWIEPRYLFGAAIE